MMIFNSLMYIACLIMILSGLLGFINYNRHLLNCLLSLEFMMLGAFFLVIMNMTKMSGEVYFSLFFLVLVVCEGTLGLSLLITMIRTHGNDYIKNVMLVC